MAEIILERLTKFFGRKNEIRALEDLSLEIAAGELLVLLGPSGSGKTTALRLIAGLEKPSAGEVRLDGKPLTQRPPHERPAGMAFQFPALLPQLTVRENLRLGPRLRKADTGESSKRVGRAAALLGITALLDRKPETLSGGQQQRAALARALVSEPRVLLLDEPLANLDPAARVELRAAIRQFQRDLRITTLYVTHDQNEAAALADRIAILDSGRLAQAGTAAELYHSPANLHVARFFGPDPINEIAGRIADGVFVSDDGQVRIPCGALRETPRTTALFRPEAVRFSGSGIPARVTDEIDWGWKKLLLVEARGQSLWAAEHGGARTGHITITSAFFFDSSGRRI